MAVEKITSSTPVTYPIHQKDRSGITENHSSKPTKSSYEDDLLEEVFTSPNPKQKWGLFTPLLIVFVIAGAILLFI